MSDLFSKLGESVKSTLKEAANQTQKSMDQAAKRTEILTRKNELKKLYQTLGEVHYKAYIGEGDAEALSGLYDQITKIRSEIAEAEGKVDSLVSEQKDSFGQYKETVKNKWNEFESELKAKENTKENTEEEKEEVCVKKICEVCQTGNNIHAAYCIHCGNKFE